jgi:hypothetical protein
MSENTIKVLFTKGDKVRLPAGTVVHTMHPSRHSNEVAIPKLPDSDAYGISRLDTAPSYDYSNAWAA